MPFAEVTRTTPNVSRNRTNACQGVVFHHTAGAYHGAVAWLRNPSSRVSAHVVIAKDGRRTVLAPDEAVTWHAGRSYFQGRRNCNDFMLGVEFELLDAHEALTDAQLQSVVEWLRPRWRRHGWSMAAMTHHVEIRDAYRSRFGTRGAPAKQDLNPTNWLRLRLHLIATLGDARLRPLQPRSPEAATLLAAPFTLRDPFSPASPGRPPAG